MALHHFLRNARSVRLGGWGVGRFRLGGGVYTVGPLSVLRFSQFVQACAGLVDNPSDLSGLLTSAPAAVLRPLVPILVQEPIKPRHLEHARLMQIVAVFTAFAEVNDTDYCLKAMTPTEGGSGKGTGLEVIAVALAERLHVGDPYTILRWPFQTVLATIDALKELDAEKPDGDKPRGADFTDPFNQQLRGLGIGVS